MIIRALKATALSIAYTGPSIIAFTTAALVGSAFALSRGEILSGKNSDDVVPHSLLPGQNWDNGDSPVISRGALGGFGSVIIAPGKGIFWAVKAACYDSGGYTYKGCKRAARSVIKDGMGYRKRHKP